VVNGTNIQIKIKMLNLNYIDFENIVKNDNRTLHYFEDDTKFVLVTKSKIEKWEYYTVIYKSEIITHAKNEEIDQDISVDMFKVNFLYNALKLESIDFEITQKTEPVPVETSPESEYIGKKKEINAGEDVVQESDKYDEFYKSVIDNWQKQTMKLLETELNKSLTDIKTKLREIFNIKPFIKNLPKIIIKIVKNGIESAEKEANIQVGYTPNFAKWVKSLEKEQLTGYTLPDGKKWYGIKGASQEDEQKIYDIVSQGVKERQSYKDIAKSISTEFESIKQTRAEGIAISETTRMISESKLRTWKEAKVKGYKGWQSALLPTTGEIDRRLHMKYNKKGIPFDDYFVDTKTGKKFFNPPTRTNCRCQNIIVFKKHPQH